VVRAAAHLLADSAADLGHAVADDADRGRVVVPVVDDAARPPPVAGAAGLGELLAAVEHPRAVEVALFDGPGEPVVARPGVADRREAPREHSSQDPARPGGHVARRPFGHPEDVFVDDRGMGVRVDQPGHDGPVPGVDDHGIAGAGQTGADVDDTAASQRRKKRTWAPSSCSMTSGCQAM
jgi:hypothetical protein